jgi:hypothetical protein
VEATGWVTLPDGKIMLTASAPNMTSPDRWGQQLIAMGRKLPMFKPVRQTKSVVKRYQTKKALASHLDIGKILTTSEKVSMGYR